VNTNLWNRRRPLAPSRRLATWLGKKQPASSSTDSPTRIGNLLATRQWEGCSGAYAIHDENDPYVKVVKGSVSNVIGLPMESLAASA